MDGKETYVNFEELIGGVDRLISYLKSEEDLIPEDSLENVIVKNAYGKSRLVVETLKEWIVEDLPKYESDKEKNDGIQN